MSSAGHSKKTPDIDATRRLFQSHGLRFTAKRARVYQALAQTETHPTALELLHILDDAKPTISLATVYNSLDSFVESGLCRRISSARGTMPCRFDADLAAHVHVMTPEGQVMDVPEDLSAEILGQVSDETLTELGRRLGLKITGVEVKISANAVDSLEST